jgi:hypothetical protein
MARFFSYLFFAFFASVLFSCTKEGSYELNTSAIAHGTLWDTSGACFPDTVYGSFYNGVTPGSDTAYVSVQVNVTTTGSYNITSDFQNGLQFADSGYFGTTGITTVKLKPIGVAIIPVTSTFTINFDSTFCSFVVTIKDSTGTGLGGEDTTGTGGDTSHIQSGQWQFTQDTVTLSGGFDSAYRDNSTGTVTFVGMAGSTSTGDTAMSLQFSILASDVQPGTYTMANNTIFFFAGDAAGNFSYEADTLVAGTDFTVVVTSYNTTTKEIIGTFSGNVENDSGAIVPLTNGSFDLILP